MKQFALPLVISAAVSGLFILGFLFSQYEKPPEKPTRIDPPTSCNLQKEDCEVALPGASRAIFSIHPRPIPLSIPIQLQVKLVSSPSSKPFESLAVDFLGKTMAMGYNRPTLKQTSPGLYEGETVLAACTEEKMEWQATVLLKRAGETLAIPFSLTTLKDYSKRKDGNSK